MIIRIYRFRPNPTQQNDRQRTVVARQQLQALVAQNATLPYTHNDRPFDVGQERRDTDHLTIDNTNIHYKKFLIEVH